ncbi:hypothetical protein GGR53DRAFT_343990 [Hypoxylon sp. FL1150]|nr:hypothetical protein GGR53DRAFT_343990 [Hypoxylon sp. FL1150]
MSSGASKPRPTRTSDSPVWTTATGKVTTAGDLVSSVRFSWDAYQTQIFHDHLMKVGPYFKHADITPLLVQLNLDGFENIWNCYGENVHSLIVQKVCRKLKNTADKIDHKVLLEASRRHNETEQQKQRIQVAPKEEKTSVGDVKPLKPAPVVKTEALFKAPNPTPIFSYVKAPSAPSITKPKEQVKPEPQSHPFLKVPKPSVAAAPSVPQDTVKREKETPPPFIFTASPAPSSPAPPTPTSSKSVKSEQSLPKLNLSGLQSPGAPEDSKTPKGASETELYRATKLLNAMLAATHEAIKNVKSALREIPEGEGKEEIAEVVHEMTIAFTDVQVDAEYLEEMAREDEAKD